MDVYTDIKNKYSNIINILNALLRLNIPINLNYLQLVISNVIKDINGFSTYLLVCENPLAIHPLIECMLLYYNNIREPTDYIIEDVLLNVHTMYNALYNILEGYFLKNDEYRLNLVYALASLDVFSYCFRKTHCKNFCVSGEKFILLESLNDLKKHVPETYNFKLERAYGRYLLNLKVLE